MVMNKEATVVVKTMETRREINVDADANVKR
jgi:hypothetical protein